MRLNLKKTLLVQTICTSLVLFHFQIPIAMAGAGDKAADFAKELSGKSLEAQTSEISASVIAEIASQLRNYEHKTDDIIYASAGGAGYIFSLTSSLKAEQKIDSLLDQFMSGGNLDSTDTLAYLDAQIDSMYKSVEVLFAKYSKQSAQATSFYWAAFAADKLIEGEQKSFLQCQKLLQEIYEKEETCEMGGKAAEDAYKTFDELIEKREDIVPSQQGKKESKNEIKQSQAKIKAVYPAYEKDAAKYESEASSAEAQASAAQARQDMVTAAEQTQKANELKQKAMVCKQVKNPEETCNELYTSLEKNEAAGSPPMSMTNPLASFNDLDIGYASTYTALMAEMGPVFDKLMLTPFKRAMIWRILGELSNNAAISTSEVIHELQLQIMKAEDIRDRTEQSTYISIPRNFKFIFKFENILNFLIDTAMAQVTTAPKPKKNPEPLKLNCLASKGNSNCVPLTTLLPRTPGFKNIPPSMRSTAMKIAKYGDDANSSPNGLSASAEANMQFLAKGRVAMVGFTKANEKIESKKALRSGLGSINYEAMKNSIMATFNAVTTNVLKKKGMTPARYLASRGVPVATNSMSSTFTSFKEVVGTAVEKVERVKNVVTGEKVKNKEEVIDNRRYKYGSADINTNPNDSIFESISIRYLKSFIQKLDSTDLEK